MNLATWLERAARASPAAVAIWHGAAPWATYAELARRAAAIAGRWRSRGLAAGDRVAFAMRNEPEYLLGLYAAWWAGLAAVPVNAKLHPREVDYIVRHSGAREVLTSAAEVRALEGGDAIPLEPLPPQALAWLFYTSGTTGRPKGAMLSHRNLAQMTWGYLACVDAVPAAGRLLHAAPLSHGSGLYNFTHLVRGAGQVVPESGGFDAAEVAQLLRAHAEVSFFAAPTIVKRLAEAIAAPSEAPGLRTLVYGGGPMYLADVRHALVRLGPRLAQIYGQGESPMTITVLDKARHADASHPRFLERLASVGVPNAVVEVAVRDERGADVPPGAIGEVCVRGDVVMSGYWNDPDASGRALRQSGDSSQRPWLWTGDLGAFDADGFLALKDRSKDLIVSGGSNIYPREVEEVLLTHPGVAEASVVGAPDPEWGERVVAFIVARGERPPEADLEALCLAHIARFKRPREYRYVDALPKNHYGKVLKTELRARLGPTQVNSAT